MTCSRSLKEASRCLLRLTSWPSAVSKNHTKTDFSLHHLQSLLRAHTSRLAFTMAVPSSPATPSAVAAGAPSKPLQGGVVRSCPSGDTIVVRPRGVVTPGAEKTIHIAGIASPRLGSRERDDDVSGTLYRPN